MIPLQAMTPEVLVAQIDGLRLDEARKVVGAVHRGASLDQPIEAVRRSALAAVRAQGTVPALARREVVASAVDPFVKYGFGTPDGHFVETVRIPLERAGRYSVCVSSQVGCALQCAFCATGRLGLSRNLATWEIVEQVRAVRRDLDAAGLGRVHGVVFQGMGEPMANLEQVLAAIEVLTLPCAQRVSAAAITVCTSGLPRGIRRLAEQAPKVRLGLSIGSARPEVRRRLMPIEGTHPLWEVVDAVADHARATGLSPLWAVTLLAGVNDSPADAEALCDLAEALVRRSGVRPRITVIPYNPIESGGSDEPFTRTEPAREQAFREVMRQRGFATHRRYSGGGDVGAACGQLASQARSGNASADRSSRPSTTGGHQ